LDIFDTIFKIGLGASIAGVISYILSKQAFQQRLKEDKLRRTDEIIINPIISFVDTLLQYMSQIHWAEQSNIEEYGKSKNMGPDVFEMLKEYYDELTKNITNSPVN
jgi:hypothetical protein